MKRKIYQDLIDWKNDLHRKSLIIKGPHQIGKTYIIREFAKDQYLHFTEINFAEDPSSVAIFESSHNLDDLVLRISVAIDPLFDEHGLLFLDEIQECPGARRFLKPFMERHIDVIATGSMLGVSDSRLGIYKKSKPAFIGVGYEDVREMHALDFEEFLWA